MHPRLCAHLDVSSSLNQARERSSYLHISPNASKTDTTLLTIVSTYLTYALTIVFQQHSNTQNARDDLPIHALSQDLDTAQDTLLSWIPLFTSLSSKHLDTILARAYTSLTKFCTTHLSSSPTQRPSSKKPATADNSHDALTHQSVYLIRMYALQCLAHTTDGVVAPTTIWEQAVRFGSAYAKSLIPSRPGRGSNPDIESEATRTILRACAKLIHDIQSMPNCERFTKDKMFVSFLEWWMTFARRVG